MTVSRYEDARLDRLFVKQAYLTPTAPALLYRGTVLTYGQLHRASNQLAHCLRDAGVCSDRLVGIHLHRSPVMIISLLAVLKAGGAYVPIDPAYPAEWRQHILRDSQVSTLLADTDIDGQLDFAGGVIDMRAVQLDYLPSDDLVLANTPDDLAYVIYTSGSTGKPKGVMLAHSASAYMQWAGSTFHPEDLAQVAATTSICFDPSVFEIFAPLCNGGSILLKENALERFRPDEHPTMLQGVPSVFVELVRAAAIPDSVRIINIGGEVLKADLVSSLYRSTNVREIYNHYGPTETTTCATVELLERDLSADPAVGKPICGAQIHIMDDHFHLVADGEVGEIHIAGPSVALGYLGQPKLTAEHFLPAIVGPAGSKMYRTGDLGRRLPSGSIEFFGRLGNQVKIRGYRIELGDVEALLSRLPNVEQAAAIVSQDALGRERLIGHLMTQIPMPVSEIREILGGYAPDYMIPTIIHQSKSLPLTPNGKIDRKQLATIEPIGVVANSSHDLSPLEVMIADVFSQTIGVDAVGGDDDFFSLGGDSLSALQVALRLEELLGQAITPAMMIHVATPRTLAATLEAISLAGEKHIWHLKAGDDDQSIICMPDVHGRPISFVSFARCLQTKRSVYGLSPGPLIDELLAHPDVATLTRGYLREVREIQPHGPYVIAGFSFGGVWAFDLACALEEKGEQVTLVLCDAPISQRKPSLVAMLRWGVRGAKLRFADGGVGALRSKLSATFRPLTDPNGVRDIALPDWVPVDDRPLGRALVKAVLKYKFSAFRGPTILICCTEQRGLNALHDHDGMLGWRGLLLGSVRRFSVDTKHKSMMREPHVQHVASLISKALGDEI